MAWWGVIGMPRQRPGLRPTHRCSCHTRMRGWTFEVTQTWVSLSIMFGELQVCVIFFCICSSIYVLMFFVLDTDIISVTRADVGEVGRPVARLVGHEPPLRPRGGQGGGGAGGPGGGASGLRRDGVGLSSEGSSSAAVELVARELVWM